MINNSPFTKYCPKCWNVLLNSINVCTYCNYNLNQYDYNYKYYDELKELQLKRNIILKDLEYIDEKIKIIENYIN